MANVTLPTFPALAPGALFVKGFANGSSAASATQYMTFGHCFQIAQLPAGHGLVANFGSGAVLCQVDAKTHYAGGSAAHALVTVQVPSVAVGASLWGQFSITGASAVPALSLGAALGSTALVLTLSPTPLADWTAAAALAGGAAIKPVAGNSGGFVYQFAAGPGTTGTTGTTEPIWPQTVGATATDGTVTWTNVSSGLPSALTEDMIALMRGASFDPWLNGPLAVQGRAAATLYQGLRVVIDLTAYADGTINADVMLANDIAMLPVAGTLWYSAVLTLNGATAYTSPALVHFQYQNWTAQVGTVPHGLRVIHNPNDFIEAQAIQPYTTTLGVAPENSTAAQGYIGAPGFGQPLTNVGTSSSGTIVLEAMGEVGGRNDIGPNDSWSAWWFVTQDPNFEAVAIEAAKINGAIPWHFWNASSGDYYKVTDTAGAGNTVGFWPAQQTDSWTVPLTQAISDATGWQIDNAHFPDLVYLVYLAGGRRYHLDELNATTWGMLCWIWPFSRSARLTQAELNEYCGTEGYCLPGSQTRVGAWTLRNILYSTYANPDGSAAKTYARQMLDSNYNWLNGQTPAWTTYEGQPYGYIPINLCSVYGNGTAMPPWQNDYLASSVHAAATMGYAPALQFARWMANFIIGRFATDISGWYPADGTTYNWLLTSGGGAPQTWADEEALLQATAGASSVTISSGAPITLWNGTTVTEPSGTPVTTWVSQEGDYAQLALNSLVGAQVVGLPNGATAYNWLVGIGAPFTDPASWAQGPIVQMVPRTLNGSQVLLTGAATNELDGTGVLAAPLASGTVVAGSDEIIGAAVFGPTVTKGGIEGLTYAELGSFLASAVSDLQGVLALFQEWEGFLAAEAKSAPPAAAAAYLKWEGAVAAEATKIQQALATLP